MKQEELKKVLAEVDPLLANAVDSMISFIHTKGKDSVPSERKIEQVNAYFDSIVSRTGKDYEKWSEYRWIASYNIEIGAIPCLEHHELDYLHKVLESIARDHSYYEEAQVHWHR